MDTNLFDDPTEPRPKNAAASGPTVPMTPGKFAATTPVANTGLASPSRRTFMGKSLSKVAIIGGASVAGVAAATVGGFALDQWVQKGGLTNLFHSSGPMASETQIGHLLRKAGFGATQADLNTYRSLGFSGAVDQLLNYQQVSESDTENRLNALNLNLNSPIDQQRWWLLRMAWTQRPLLEKMTLFWHGVLTSSFRKVGGKNAYVRMINQNNFLRAHAFDTFDTILLGITADPAMLFYLDLTKSTKAHPNENYARELMELFTLGLGNYTQQDVYMGAAALTGWHARGLTSQYYPNDHSNLTKTYLGHTGNLDYKDVVNILANHPATPWFISRKLFTFFVYENPSVDDLKPLVASYTQSGHNMGAVMRTLLLSPQFSSSQAYRSRVKSPVEFTVGAYRQLGLTDNGMSLPGIATLMGQTIFDPPNVAGWPGDKVSSLWLNSGTWMTRLNYVDLLLVRGSNARNTTPAVNLQAIVDTNKIDSPSAFVDYFASFLLDGNFEADHRTQLIDYFTTSDTSRGGQKITLANGQSYPFNRVRGTLYLMMTLPEYQLN